MIELDILSILVVKVNPIRIGKLLLESNLVQGPLAGYSSAPFRVLTHRYGKPGFCTTEMISAKDLVHRAQPINRYTYRDPEEGLLSYQLSGHQPDELARAATLLSSLGADIIDLNAGCPVNKIRSKHCGSALLASPEKIYACLRAIKQNTDAAVSIKIRVAGEHHDQNDLAIADAIEQSGADWMTVHGRHWTEHYETPARYSSIAAIKQEVKIPVFANGDVDSPTALKTILETTRCDGVMIARASVGRPWLFEECRAALSGQAYSPPALAEIGEIFWEHIQGLIALAGEPIALFEARKWVKYYGRTVANLPGLIEGVHSAHSSQELQQYIQGHFNPN